MGKNDGDVNVEQIIGRAVQTQLCQIWCKPYATHKTLDGD